MFMESVYIPCIWNNQFQHGFTLYFKICTVFVEVTISLFLKLVIGIIYVHYSIFNLSTGLELTKL